MSYQVAVVGTGNPERAGSYAMAYRHASGYDRLDDCELVGCADIVVENARSFARTFGLGPGQVYEDHERLLAEQKPDIVSVCTPTATHAEIVLDCASHGVDAVHCEKPMAERWTECREMVAACESADVQLTFNHQRRFAAPYRTAKSLLDDGRIGSLRRVEIGGDDLYDYGTHLFDMCGYVTDQTPVEWVMGQVDCRGAERVYGLYRERSALATWRYDSGVRGLVSTGEDRLVGCELRLVGTDGVIEIGPDDGPPLRVRDEGSGWRAVDTGRDGLWRVKPHPVDRVLERAPVGPDELLSDPPYVARAVADVVACLRNGTGSELSAANALQTTEIIFACWESARRGALVELPLEIEDNPLQAIVERDGLAAHISD